jgi:plastocyanin domain-containing protein
MSNSLKRRLQAVALMLGTFTPLAGSPSFARGAEQAATIREIQIVVDGGYSPTRVDIKQGERVRLKFVRKDWNGCSRELVIPALELRRELPPNKAVTIDLPALAPGEYEFRCGMNMIRGTIVVSAA